MPERYHVPVVPTPARFRPIGKFGTVDWREDCSRCKNCVKNLCVYGIYREENAWNRDPSQPVEPLSQCHACLSCVQSCTKGLLQLAMNEEYLTLGDGYWTPGIISTTWNQAETGKIPVSGAGYRGRFFGPGFDSMWTDMSEIVRPTRDGIHGREYINTSVDIGTKPMRLAFNAAGGLAEPFALVDVPLPAILDIEPWETNANVTAARLQAAAKLGTLAVAPPERIDASGDVSAAVPLFEGGFSGGEALLSRVRMIEIAGSPSLPALAEKARAVNPNLIIAARLPLDSSALARVLALNSEGVKVFHLCADNHGREMGVEDGRFIKDVLREIHTWLVGEGIRDDVTLIASGGIALAEHMAKSIICGADLVAVNVPLMIALGCRVCCGDHNGSCPVSMGDAGVDYAAQRMVNLMGAWHSQLIEVLGAMGIREVRRLRGETGRAMFLEDLEREAFSDLGN